MNTMMKSMLKVVLLLVCAVLFCLTSGHAYSLEKGVYLVAKKQINDPRFRDRVILLIQHDKEGSAGLVVNRASSLPLGSVLAQESPLADLGKVLSYGGPLDPNTVLALVKVRKNPPEPADVVLNNVYVTGVSILDRWPDYNHEVIDFRPFVGYTGWAPGQLIAEMKRGDWHVVPADEESLFTAKDEQLWVDLREKVNPGQ